MYQINFVFFLILFIISSILTDDNFNSTETSIVSIEQSCIFCQTTACHCPTEELTLNCSYYLLDLPYIENCSHRIIWEIVDFSSRNFESLDSKKLLSLRMKRLLLKSNLITTIHDNTFDSIGDILIELNLEMNQLVNISSNWLNSKIIYLKKLNLALNQLEVISFDHIQLSNLRELNLSRNQIDIFPDKIHQWTSLTILDLSFNKLSSIPRYALMGLNNLTWLSLASNRNLNCIIQDSFKYLKSLQYLDLSSTSLLEFDACILFPLIGLKTLRLEHVTLNCTSCWLPIARENSLQLFGQCLNNQTIQSFDSLTDKQFQYACSKSSIDCTSDYCEPGSINHDGIIHKTFSLSKTSYKIKNPTVKIILSIVFSIITFIISILFIILLSRWKQGKKLFCCHFLQTTTATTIAEATRRRRQHHKQIIDNNPVVIESVVTHGANMNVPPYPHNNYAYLNDEISNNKRKLYNPMFADSPTSDIRQQQQQQQQQPPVVVVVSDDSTSYNSHSYSEQL
ncbi:unnamed protein product [Adineta steineri]|uniref:Uncharacterized protein n=1 Tax=Adineta steineri TaxID=433720 RepID=A0A819R8F8_9BILA|nr:unnamed protein product [Adineta steineri]CAF4036447.1 unnamed protein product [Adineta steineri]